MNNALRNFVKNYFNESSDDWNFISLAGSNRKVPSLESIVGEQTCMLVFRPKVEIAAERAVFQKY